LIRVCKFVLDKNQGSTIKPTMANTKGKKGESGSSKKQITNEVVTREYTVNLHKRLHGV